MVERGDCLLSIAHQRGFFWETLWNLPENADLRNARQDPGLLLVGDRVMVPERQLKTEPAATDAHHRFLKRGVPAKLRVVVEYEDQPVANADYILTVDGEIRQGTTDDKGLLEVPIAPEAAQAVLDIEGLRFELQLGALDPGSEDIGIQQRLANLGFYHGDLDGKIGPQSREAIAAYQARTGLDVTGEPDDDTLDLLLHRHDELHERLPEETVEDSDSGPESDAAPDDESGQ